MQKDAPTYTVAKASFPYLAWYLYCLALWLAALHELFLGLKTKGAAPSRGV